MRATMITGLRAREPKSGNTSTTLTFVNSMNGLWFSNDGASDLTIKVNNETFTVKAGQVLDEYFEEFKSVVVTNAGGSAFRTYGRC